MNNKILTPSIPYKKIFDLFIESNPNKNLLHSSFYYTNLHIINKLLFEKHSHLYISKITVTHKYHEIGTIFSPDNTFLTLIVTESNNERIYSEEEIYFFKTERSQFITAVLHIATII